LENYLLSLGLPGVVILALSAAVVKLFGLYQEVQDKRLEEFGKSTATLLEVTNQLILVTQALEVMTRTSR
jgi:hypothetical protein